MTRSCWKHVLRACAVAGVASISSCTDDPAEPVGDTTFDRAMQLSGSADDLESIRNYLGASSYRLYFGRDGATGGSSLARILGTSPFSLAASPGPTDFSDVLVNDRVPPGLGQSEVTIASKGNIIVAAWNDARGFFVFADGISGWGISTDRGQTWTDGGSFPRMNTAGFRHAGDPALAADEFGNFFFADLCLEPTVGPFPHICFTRGPAVGGTVNWQTPVFAASSATDFLDKELIAVDRSGTNVYISYTRFINAGGFGQIEVVSSHDGGATWGTPVIVSPATPGTVNQGSEPAVAPNGDVYVVWERDWLTSLTPRIMFSKSTDGGATFSTPTPVATIGTLAFTPPSGYNRPVINDFPRIAVAETGKNRGDIYVTFHSVSAGDADVYVSRSSDGGTTWSAPALVNDDGVAGALQFWPAVVVEPGGNVDFLFYDRRDNPGTPITHVYWAQSIDGTASFRANVRLSDVPTNWAATVSDIIPNFGDYNDLSASGNRTFAAWGDGRLGDPDVFFSELRGKGKSK